jgi:signal transduction histidine kinase
VALHIGVDQLSLTIQDDGRGMPVDPSEIDRVSAAGLGLVGMEERVRELGGSFEIYSQPGKGTLIKVSIPVPAEEVA